MQTTTETEAADPVSDEDLSPEDIADLETYAAKGEKPPKAKAYRVRIDRDHYIFRESNPTREEILEKANRLPVEMYTLRLKLHGGGFDRIDKGERVDLTRHGVEKFKTLPNDQTEG